MLDRFQVQRPVFPGDRVIRVVRWNVHAIRVYGAGFISLKRPVGEEDLYLRKEGLALCPGPVVHTIKHIAGVVLEVIIRFATAVQGGIAIGHKITGFFEIACDGLYSTQ